MLLLSPDPSVAPGSSVPAQAVSPGPVGFLWMVLLVIIVVFLAIDLTRRIRRMRYRGEIRERLEAEARRDAEARAQTGIEAKAPGDQS